MQPQLPYLLDFSHAIDLGCNAGRQLLKQLILAPKLLNALEGLLIHLAALVAGLVLLHTHHLKVGGGQQSSPTAGGAHSLQKHNTALSYADAET